MVQATRVTEVIDVSYLRDVRGFDIHGHRSWFQHPWASSDLLMAILFGLPAAQRGLVPADDPGEWAMPADYPHRVRAIAAPLILGRDRAPAFPP